MRAGVMEVTVVGARDLKNAEFLGRMKPYVVIQYKNEEQKSTTGPRNSRFKRCICRQGQGGKRAVWNEKFKFKVEFPGSGVEEQENKLVLKIMDHDSFTSHDCLGQATIYLKSLLEIGLENGKAELPIQKYRIVSTNNTYHGEIQVGITFTLDEENKDGCNKN